MSKVPVELNNWIIRNTEVESQPILCGTNKSMMSQCITEMYHFLTKHPVCTQYFFKNNRESFKSILKSQHVLLIQRYKDMYTIYRLVMDITRSQPKQFYEKVVLETTTPDSIYEETTKIIQQVLPTFSQRLFLGESNDIDDYPVDDWIIDIAKRYNTEESFWKSLQTVQWLFEELYFVGSSEDVTPENIEYHTRKLKHYLTQVGYGSKNYSLTPFLSPTNQAYFRAFKDSARAAREARTTGDTVRNTSEAMQLADYIEWIIQPST